ncbi:Mannosyl-oligosaccharide 1,2-alpha-mannosidase IC [Bagarius yarrelli]|uniref:Mannosyl-oligosaccharide 1,2-alpha-mannosidase IC n=1 Tax=Bagarius yarrelli TaxID=175774 RepID=A0A556TLY5_BAGYA|nr:Mannosyl-oligosaccharide 1,2-alpha-mannosidase IC [Bagarius yarrelli]
MAFRKLPGVPVSAMGIRLTQKFTFLLFVSGLLTLCLGALFLLPDSVRLKRIFLPKSESANTVVTQRGQTLELAEGNNQLKMSPKPSVMRSDSNGAAVVRHPGAHEEERVEKPQHGDGDATAGTAAGREKGYTYDTFRKCLLKPALGSDRGRPSDPQTVQRRDKVREEKGNSIRTPFPSQIFPDICESSAGNGQERKEKRWEKNPSRDVKAWK